jgi:hypothetical protein
MFAANDDSRTVVYTHTTRTHIAKEMAGKKFVIEKVFDDDLIMRHLLFWYVESQWRLHAATFRCNAMLSKIPATTADA